MQQLVDHYNKLIPVSRQPGSKMTNIPRVDNIDCRKIIYDTFNPGVDIEMCFDCLITINTQKELYEHCEFCGIILCITCSPGEIRTFVKISGNDEFNACKTCANMLMDKINELGFELITPMTM